MSQIPIEIRCHQVSKTLELLYEGGERYELSFEYLRVYSPSAEVRGHGIGEGKLEVGKQAVGIKSIEPVGNYAIKIHFDDGHETGIYSWAYLYELASQQEEKWQAYQKRLKQEGCQ